jgi:hypothetical protein
MPSGTIEFWLNVSGTGGSVDQYPYPGACSGYTLGIYVASDQTLVSEAWAAFNMASTVTVPLNEWFHLATTWGSAGAKLYLNGVPVASDPTTGGPASGYGGSLILSQSSALGATAIFDELRVSNIRAQCSTFHRRPIEVPSTAVHLPSLRERPRST